MRRKNKCQLSITSALEIRQLLAGNVQASFANFTVTITGDRSKNDIQLNTDASGLHVVATNGTSLNGVLNGSLLFPTFDQVAIDLQAADDALSIRAFQGGGISIQLGTGNDFAALSAVVADSLNVDGGTGNDFISLDDNIAENVFQGSVTLIGNDGNDSIQNIGTALQGNFLMTGGKGNDKLGWANGSAGSNSQILSGKGNDNIALSSVNVPSGFTFTDEAGNDLVGLENSVFGSTAIFALGSGNDSLISNANAFAIVDRQGGSGRDTLFRFDETVPNETFSSFESFPVEAFALAQKLNDAFPFFG